MANSPVLLRMEGVSKIYGAGEAATVALDDVSLDIHPGSWTAIMGPSGHGKTTLLQLMGGLDRPSAGRVLLAGDDLASLSAHDVAQVRGRRLGFVFQFFNLLPHLTALENIELALWFGGGDVGKRRSTALTLLDRVGLAGKANSRPAALSGGQQQRVAIARALANKPELLLMDEPTGNLDTQSEIDVLGLLSQLHREGRTLVLVTHSEAVASIAGHVVRMRDGRIESRVA